LSFVWQWRIQKEVKTANQHSCDVVVKHFGDDEIAGITFVKSGNELRAQLLDCIVLVQCQQVTYWLLVVAWHKYHTWARNEGTK